MKTVKWLAIGTAVCLFVNFKAAGDVLYNNAANNTGYQLTMANGQQTGSEILLGTPPNSYYLTNFSFNYSSSGSAWGDVTLDVILQLNDGPTYNGYATPGTVIYDSGTFNPANLNGDGGLDFTIDDLSLGDTVPLNSNATIANDFTLSFIVTGLTGDDAFALDLYNPATIGANYGDYWLNLGTQASPNWELLTNSISGPVGVASEFYGSVTPAPEPTVISLGILSGVGLLLAARRRRQ
jgi:hypothetical protein